MTNEEKTARAIIGWSGCTEPFAICRQLGIHVLFSPLKGVRGFCERSFDVDMIFIDTALNPDEAAFVCSHELGHLLMHSVNSEFLASHTYQVVGKYELSADRFATMLLWPDDHELLEYADLSLEHLSNLMGVSEDLVKWRYEQISME